MTEMQRISSRQVSGNLVVSDDRVSWDQKTKALPAKGHAMAIDSIERLVVRLLLGIRQSLLVSLPVTAARAKPLEHLTQGVLAALPSHVSPSAERDHSESTDWNQERQAQSYE